MLEGKWEAEGSTAKGLEEFVEAVGPEAYNDVILRRYIAQRGGDGWRERNLETIVANLRESGG